MATDKRTIHFAVTGLPLIIYPFLLIANVMSLAGYSEDNTLTWEMTLAKLFLWGTTLYPVVYLGCLIFFIARKKMLFITIPYVYLAICIVLFFLWSS